MAPALRVVSDPTPPMAAAGTESREDGPLLFSKGSASASGFRPAYWSYEPTDEAPPVSEGAVVPAAGMVRLTQSLGQIASNQRAHWAIIAFGCVALMISAYAMLRPAPPAQGIAKAAPPALAAAPRPPAPATPAVAETPPPQPDAAVLAERQEIDMLMARGNDLLSTGDVVSARLYFERAAQRDARAALLLAQTYDPAFLRRLGVLGVRGDPGKAAEWYRRAQALDPAVGGGPR